MIDHSDVKRPFRSVRIGHCLVMTVTCRGIYTPDHVETLMEGLIPTAMTADSCGIPNGALT